MRPYHKCLDCTPWVDPDGVHRENWNRCMYLVDKPHCRGCTLAKYPVTMTVLDDGRIKPALCPLDIGGVRF